jgi:hypothetical protein
MEQGTVMSLLVNKSKETENCNNADNDMIMLTQSIDRQRRRQLARAQTPTESLHHGHEQAHISGPAWIHCRCGQSPEKGRGRQLLDRHLGYDCRRHVHGYTRLHEDEISEELYTR